MLLLIITYILGLLIFTTSCGHLMDCLTRGEKINDYIYNTKVPYGDQLTWRNDSLIISSDYTVNYNEILQPYNSYINKNPKFISGEKHFLINSSTGQLIDTLKIDFAPTFNRGKISSAFFSTDTNTIKKGNILVHKYILTKDYKGYQINFEWWKPNVRCPGEHRIAVYKEDKNLKNFFLEYGINDYLLNSDNIIILTAYSEWPDWGGRHLQKVSLDKIIQGLK